MPWLFHLGLSPQLPPASGFLPSQIRSQVCAHENAEQVVTKRWVHTPLPHIPAQDAHPEASGIISQTHLNTPGFQSWGRESLGGEVGTTVK